MMPNMIERSREALGLPQRSILLTFDDGPVGKKGQTDRLLDVLQNHGVKAAFCVVGSQVAKEPEICRRIHREGHLIANHTFRHLSPFFQSAEQLEQDIQRADEAIAEALGNSFTSPYFRPPAGFLSPKVCAVMRRLEKKVLPMTFFAWDTMHIPGLRYLMPRQLRIHAKLMQGGVYMIHEAIIPLTGNQALLPPDRSWLPDVMDTFISKAKADGFTFLEPQEALQQADSVIEQMIAEPT